MCRAANRLRRRLFNQTITPPSYAVRSSETRLGRTQSHNPKSVSMRSPSQHDSLNAPSPQKYRAAPIELHAVRIVPLRTFATGTSFSRKDFRGATTVPRDLRSARCSRLL